VKGFFAACLRIAGGLIAGGLTAAGASCGAEDPAAADARLAAAIGFEPDVARRIRAHGEALERLVGAGDDLNEAPAMGLVLVVGPGEGREVLPELREELAATDYAAYLMEQGFGFGHDRIAIVRGNDPYAYLAIVRTDGIHYDLTHEDVVARYREWDQRYGLSLVGAGLVWLEAELERPPPDWLAFAREVYEVCPDVVDQGTGDVRALADEMQRTGTLYLWWD
jgi:hypothetical protein